jgi:hypothetical protein
MFPQCAGQSGADPASWAVFDEKPIISRAEKTTLLGEVCTVPDLAWASSSIDDARESQLASLYGRSSVRSATTQV